MKNLISFLFIFSLLTPLAGQDYPFPTVDKGTNLIQKNALAKRVGIGTEIGLLGGNSLKNISILGNMGYSILFRLNYGTFKDHLQNTEMDYFSSGFEIGDKVINNFFQYFISVDYGRAKFSNGKDYFWLMKFGGKFYTDNRFSLSVDAGLFSGLEINESIWMKNAVVMSLATHVYVW